MRSPWLSREYKKSKNVVVNKCIDGYELSNINTGSKIILSANEYEKYDKSLFDEIEWEKLFLRGLASDKNCNDFEFDDDFDDCCGHCTCDCDDDCDCDECDCD